MTESSDRDAWTFVKSKKARKSRQPRHTKVPSCSETQSEDELEPGPKKTNLQGLEQTEKEYAPIRQQWLASECCERVRQAVRKQAVDSCFISQAVCLGLGSFDPEGDSWNYKRASYTQLAAFIVMVEELEAVKGSKIRCIFQDPCFTIHDKAFIKGFGYEVVDSPAAYPYIDEDSFLYSVHLYRPVYAAALQKAIPKVFVGTDVADWQMHIMGRNPDLGQLLVVDESHVKIPFPKDGNQETFSSTVIYWRPSNDVMDHSNSKSTRKGSEGSQHQDVEKLNVQLAAAKID